ncbi:MAG: glucose-6-phosphate dehydrogenase assembly protein OpcA [Thermodesulfobacteriota bacterium]
MSAPSPPAAGGPAFAAYPAKPVDVERIERELTALWSEPPAGADAAPVTRACMSNLIVFAPDRDAATRLGEEVVPIVEHHPSRVLMLVADGMSGGEPLEAYVSALCHLGDDGRQVCSEHVVISAAERMLRRLPSVVRPLILGDLPTALWWSGPSPPSQGGEVFRELAEDASQVIFDSLEWTDQERAFVETAAWAAGVPRNEGVSDLAWTRLGPWRSLVSQALDPAVAPGALECLLEVEVEHGARTAPQAWLLVAWLADRLRWKLAGARQPGARQLEWSFTTPGVVEVRAVVRPGDPSRPEAFATRLRWGAQQKPSEVRVVCAGGERIAILAGGAPTHGVVVPSRSRAALVAQEMADLGRDAVYRSSLDTARKLVDEILA